MAEISRCKPLLGTYVELSLCSKILTDSQLLELSQLGFVEIEKIHQLMSFHETESDLSRINRQASSQVVSITSDIHKVLQQALMLSEQTNGLFDISIAPLLMEQSLLPVMENVSIDSEANWQDIVLNESGVRFKKPLAIDLGGIAKGYAVDKAYEAILETSKDPDIKILINAGGDLRFSQWQQQPLLIPTPFFENPDIELLMQNSAVATSGDYLLEGKHAILSKQSMVLENRPLSVSVFAENCMIADALTKWVFLSPKPLELLQIYKAKAFIIKHDKNNEWLN